VPWEAARWLSSELELRGAVLIGLSGGAYLAESEKFHMTLRRNSRDPHPVTFPSADGRTVLIGYVWRPISKKRAPGIIMLHGRSGVYSTSATTSFSARFLSKRHLMWGGFWAEHGYVALLVDSFGPRGYVRGFARNSIRERPPEVSEKNVRPLDAYGAATWLRAQDDLKVESIGLQGWSNGAMATLWAMSDKVPKQMRLPLSEVFGGALAFYPGCSRIAEENPDFIPYAPTLLLLAGADKEVSPRKCQIFGQHVRENGGNAEFNVHIYPGADHSFDHPGAAGASNAQARADARRKALEFFGKHLKGPPHP
jgi:dienelactone hydrolase